MRSVTSPQRGHKRLKGSEGCAGSGETRPLSLSAHAHVCSCIPAKHHVVEATRELTTKSTKPPGCCVQGAIPITAEEGRLWINQDVTKFSSQHMTRVGSHLGHLQNDAALTRHPFATLVHFTETTVVQTGRGAASPSAGQDPPPLLSPPPQREKVPFRETGGAVKDRDAVQRKRRGRGLETQRRAGARPAHTRVCSVSSRGFNCGERGRQEWERPHRRLRSREFRFLSTSPPERARPDSRTQPACCRARKHVYFPTSANGEASSFPLFSLLLDSSAVNRPSQTHPSPPASPCFSRLVLPSSQGAVHSAS